MKLAEALILRTDYQKKLTQINSRLSKNALVQEGENPSEDPKDLMAEFEDLTELLEKLIIMINKINSSTVLSGNETVADLLAKRDILKIRLKAYQLLADTASEKQDRYSRSEIKMLSTINIIDLRKKIDSLSKDYRLIDVMIQEYNWKIDIE